MSPDFLINASGPNSFAYLYDAVGNRTLDVNNTATTQYYYDLSSQKLLSQTGARPDTILADAAGNVTQSRGNTYGYGPDQRLAAVLQGTSTIATYSYNPQGQRIAKTTGSTTNFDYDLQGRLLEENDIPGNYVYLDGEPLARVDYNLSDISGNVASWNIAFYHNNPVGAPVQTTDQNGNVSWTGQMEPFGSVLPINPNITQNLPLPGRYFDQETGLHYNYLRDYDPPIERYIESDPIGLAGGMNTYAYVGNNPLTRIDPDGRVWGAALRLFLVFMPMIDLQMMAVDDVPGGGKACALENGTIALAKSRFGHTFTTHGQDATDFLINRASGSGKPVGQFLDDQAAARFIQDNLDNLKNGAISVPVPSDLPVRIIMPDGSFVPASTIRLVPGGKGVKTAYPEP